MLDIAHIVVPRLSHPLPIPVIEAETSGLPSRVSSRLWRRKAPVDREPSPARSGHRRIAIHLALQRFDRFSYVEAA